MTTYDKVLFTITVDVDVRDNYFHMLNPLFEYIDQRPETKFKMTLRNVKCEFMGKKLYKIDCIIVRGNDTLELLCGFYHNKNHAMLALTRDMKLGMLGKLFYFRCELCKKQNHYPNTTCIECGREATMRPPWYTTQIEKDFHSLSKIRDGITRL